MCDPITIGSAILTGVSVAANSYAQSQVTSARNDALAAERIRQQGYDKQADALNAQSQNRYVDFKDQQDTKAKSLGDYFQQAQTPATPAPELVPASSSNVVVQEQAKQSAKAKDYSNQQANALGNLRAFGDALGTDSRLQARDAGQIAQIGNFKQGSSNVLQQELQDANNAGAGWKTFGDLLGLGGQLGFAAAGPGAFNSLNNGLKDVLGISRPIASPITSSMLGSAGSSAGSVIRGTGGLY